MRPPDEDRPGDPKIPGATHHLDDQTATKQPGADCNPSADSPGAVEIGFAEHLARIGYDTDTPEGATAVMGPEPRKPTGGNPKAATEPQPRTRSKSRCRCKGISRREH